MLHPLITTAQTGSKRCHQSNVATLVLGTFRLHFLNSGWRRGHVGHLYFQQCPSPPDVVCQDQNDQSCCQASFRPSSGRSSCPTGERVPVLIVLIFVFHVPPPDLRTVVVFRQPLFHLLWLLLQHFPAELTHH